MLCSLQPSRSNDNTLWGPLFLAKCRRCSQHSHQTPTNPLISWCWHQSQRGCYLMLRQMHILFLKINTDRHNSEDTPSCVQILVRNEQIHQYRQNRQAWKSCWYYGITLDYSFPKDPFPEHDRWQYPGCCISSCIATSDLNRKKSPAKQFVFTMNH